MPGPIAARNNLRRRVVEAAGTTTAECAAVWCCFPCGIANLILFAVYRIPAGICRRMIRRRRERRKIGKARVMANERGCECDLCEGFSVMGKDGGENEGIVMLRDLVKMKVGNGSYGAAEEEEEMLRKFYGSGFWRSPSRNV